MTLYDGTVSICCLIANQNWFRHSHATHAIEEGVPVHLVQATLGQFGFSIQQQIWEEIKQNEQNEWQATKAFVKQVGWNDNDQDPG